MSDGAISQQEIDALLSSAPVDGLSDTGHVTSGGNGIDTESLKTFADNIKDLLPNKLNGMTGANFELTDVTVESATRDALLAKLGEVVVCVSNDYSNVITGDHSYMLDGDFAQKLVNLITKEEGTELDDMALSCICDAVSMHTGSELDEIGKSKKFPGVECSAAAAVNNPKAMIKFPADAFALFSYALKLDDATYNLYEIIGASAAKSIASIYAKTPEPAPQQPNPAMANQQAQQMAAQQAAMQQQMMMGQMGQMGMPQMGQSMNIPNVQPLQYPTLQGVNMGSEQGNISLIMDVFMEMTVELGRTKKQIKDILGMGEGTIIELDKLAGEPVDILVNHKPIAKGEVVVIDENFGVRVTAILSPNERLPNMG